MFFNKNNIYAPIAQMDRATASGAVCTRSIRVRGIVFEILLRSTRK